MRAAFIERYGGPEVVQVGERPAPVAGPGELLVQVKAASINPVDFKLREGKLKALLPHRFPLVLGNDLSGVVREAGAGVTRFRPGDEVHARVDKLRLGAFAELAVVAEAHAAKKPRKLTHEEAASIPLAGLTAWQAFTDLGKVGPGSKVLVHAGAGGVGVLAIQLAKALGAYVATTASQKNHALVKELGADLAIDYKAEDFAARLSGFDLVLDSAGGDTTARSLRVLRPGGLLVSIAAPLPTMKVARAFHINPLLAGVLGLVNLPMHARARARGVRYEYHFMWPSGAQLEQIDALIDQGKVRPVIDRSFPLARIREALAHVESGQARGKVVIEI